MYENVYSSITHNSKKMETNQIPGTVEWRRKKCRLFIFEILHSSENEWAKAKCIKMVDLKNKDNESQDTYSVIPCI